MSDQQGFYVNEHGEVVEAGVHGAIFIPMEDDLEHFRPNPQPDEEWLADFMAKEMSLVEAEEKILKAAHADRMAALKRRKAFLNWKYLARLRAVLRPIQQKEKGRFLATPHGRHKFTRSTSRVVAEELLCLSWASEHCPDAIKRGRDTLLKSELPDDCPHLEIVEKDNYKFKAGA